LIDDPARRGLFGDAGLSGVEGGQGGVDGGTGLPAGRCIDRVAVFPGGLYRRLEAGEFQGMISVTVGQMRGLALSRCEVNARATCCGCAPDAVLTHF
jgi:hypothetical protein